MKALIRNEDDLHELLDALREKVGDEDKYDAIVEAFFLSDGVYFSEEKPIRLDYHSTQPVEFDTDTDFLANPYQTETIFIWKGKKPERIEHEGQGNYGSSLSFEAKKPGFFVTCFEDD